MTRRSSQWLRTIGNALIKKMRWFSREDALFIFAQLTSFIANLCLLLVLTRMLSPGEYADYALVSSGIGFLVPLSSAGLSDFVIRQYRNGPNRHYDLRFAVIVTFLITAGLTVLVVCFGWMFRLVERPPAEMAAIAILIPLTGLLIVANGLYRAERRAGPFFMAGSGQRLISLGALLVLFILVPALRTVEGYLVASLAATLVTIFALRLRVFPSVEPGKARDIGSVRLALAFSIPMALANCVSMARPFLERILIINFFNDTTLGQYAFNSEIALKSLAIANLAIKLIIFPKIATGDHAHERRNFSKIVRISLISAIPAYFLFFLITIKYNEIFSIIIGREIYLNVNLFRILGIYAILSVLGYIFQIGLILSGKTHHALTAIALSTLAHLSTVYLIGSKFGIESVAASLVIAQGLSVALLFWAARPQGGGRRIYGLK